MSLQDSFSLHPEPGMHVCIGCGRTDTSHPSMICNQCAAGSPEGDPEVQRLLARLYRNGSLRLANG